MKLLTRSILLLTIFFAYLESTAQVTTSGLSGLVKANNEPLTGATVVITHIPTGTVYTTTTNKNGQYFANNIQPGGPYRVEVSFVGFEKEMRDDINLNL